MAKQIRYNGAVHSFPDDSTDDEITEALGGASAPSTISAGNGAPPMPKAPFEKPQMQELPSAASSFGSSFKRGLGIVSPQEGHDFFAHPIDTAKGIVKAQGDTGNLGINELKGGNYKQGIPDVVYSALPFIGPSLSHSAHQLVEGDIGGGVGTSLGVAAPMALAHPSVSEIPSAIKGAINKTGGSLAQKIVSPMTYENVGETAADVRTGTDPARGIVDEGLVGTKKGLAGTPNQPGKIDARLGELKSSADNILQNHPNSRQLINAEPIIDSAINDAIASAKKVGGNTARLEQLRGALKGQYGKLQGTPYEINNLKTDIQEGANRLGAFKNTQPDEASAANAMRDTASRIKNAVNEKVPEAAQLNQRMSDLIDAKAGITRKINASKGEDLFGGHTGITSKIAQRTLGSAPVRTGIARVLNAGNVKNVPSPQSYVPPPIAGLLKAAPIELGSEMEPIGQPSAPQSALPYRPSLQKPPAFVAPGQIKPAAPPNELLFPNESPKDFPAGSFPQQGNMFQIPVEVQRALGLDSSPLDKPNGGSGGLPINPSPEAMAAKPSAIPSPDYEYKPEGVKQDTGEAVRSEKPPIPRGDRRTRTRTSDELATQDAWKQARKELGDDATSEAIEGRVGEIKNSNVPAVINKAIEGEVVPKSSGRLARKGDLKPLGGADNVSRTGQIVENVPGGQVIHNSLKDWIESQGFKVRGDEGNYEVEIPWTNANEGTKGTEWFKARNLKEAREALGYGSR